VNEEALAHWGLSNQKQTNNTHYFLCGMIIINNKGYVTSLTDSQLSKQFTGPKLPVKYFRYGDEFHITWGRGLWIGRTSTNCGGAVGEALCYNPEGRGFDSRWSHWNFSFN